MQPPWLHPTVGFHCFPLKQLLWEWSSQGLNEATEADGSCSCCSLIPGIGVRSRFGIGTRLVKQ